MGTTQSKQTISSNEKVQLVQPVESSLTNSVANLTIGEAVSEDGSLTYDELKQWEKDANKVTCQMPSS